MQHSKPSFKSRLPIRASVLLGIGLILYFFLPLFRIVPLKEAREQSAAAAFDPANFAAEFWNDQLQKGAAEAIDVAELLSIFNQDRNAATERYGHRLGLSSNASYFVSGSGRIIRVEKRLIEVAIEGGGVVGIKTGPVFGNAIRDGSGLLDVSDFPNSRDFNAVSAQINRLVEETVFPGLQAKAAIGVTLRFVGGVDVADAETEISRLNLVPVVIEFP